MKKNNIKITFNRVMLCAIFIGIFTICQFENIFSQIKNDYSITNKFTQNKIQVDDNIVAVETQNQDFIDSQEIPQVNTACFIQNKGQIANAEGIVQDEVLFTTSVDKSDLFFLKDKIIFITKEKHFVETEQSIDERAKGNIEYAEQLELQMKHYRFELVFNNTIQML